MRLKPEKLPSAFGEPDKGVQSDLPDQTARSCAVSPAIPFAIHVAISPSDQSTELPALLFARGRPLVEGLPISPDAGSFPTRPFSTTLPPFDRQQPHDGSHCAICVRPARGQGVYEATGHRHVRRQPVITWLCKSRQPLPRLTPVTRCIRHEPDRPPHSLHIQPPPSSISIRAILQ